MNIDSIIFDLDGTLWNSIEGVCGAWKTVLANHPNIDKIITTQDMENCMGLTIDNIGKKLFPDLDEALQMQLMKECCDAEQIYLGEHGGKLYPNLEETLKVLKGKYRISIVSNCADGYIESFLNSSKLDKYFVDYIAAAKYKVTKAEAIRQVIQRNDINSAIYVGDTINDYKATLGAEVDFIQAKYGFGEDLGTEYSIEDISQLPELLENLEYVRVF